MKENDSKSRFELFVELIKALAWPLFAAVVLISFWGPLRSASKQLPNLVSRSETLSIAGLSLKMGKGLNRQPSEKIKKTLSELSPDGIQRLLNTGGSIWWTNEYSGKADYAELVRLGLMEEIPENELRAHNEESGKRYIYALRQTSHGKETQNFLYALISEFVQELAKSTGEASSKD